MLKLPVRGEEEASQGGQPSGDPPARQGSGREEPRGEPAPRRSLHLQPPNGAGCTERAGARHSPHPGHPTALPARPSLRLRESAAGRSARTPPPRRAVTHERYADVLGKNKPLLVTWKNKQTKSQNPNPKNPNGFAIVVLQPERGEEAPPAWGGAGRQAAAAAAPLEAHSQGRKQRPPRGDQRPAVSFSLCPCSFLNFKAKLASTKQHRPRGSPRGCSPPGETHNSCHREPPVTSVSAKQKRKNAGSSPGEPPQFILNGETSNVTASIPAPLRGTTRPRNARGDPLAAVSPPGPATLTAAERHGQHSPGGATAAGDVEIQRLRRGARDGRSRTGPGRGTLTGGSYRLPPSSANALRRAGKAPPAPAGRWKGFLLPDSAEQPARPAPFPCPRPPRLTAVFSHPCRVASPHCRSPRRRAGTCRSWANRPPGQTSCAAGAAPLRRDRGPSAGDAWAAGSCPVIPASGAARCAGGR
ncbi:basic salivary proline-rich protein 2-like [Pezoporus occidentalis]|uniref:basic salivary proline-rich protein 2-like n=1 Tax=Pezoporus occidentalis TaxID=407982 RepID=UPI002F919F27